MLAQIPHLYSLSQWAQAKAKVERKRLEMGRSCRAGSEHLSVMHEAMGLTVSAQPCMLSIHTGDVNVERTWVWLGCCHPWQSPQHPHLTQNTNLPTGNPVTGAKWVLSIYWWLRPPLPYFQAKDKPKTNVALLVCNTQESPKLKMFKRKKTTNKWSILKASKAELISGNTQRSSQPWRHQVSLL